MNKSSKLLMVIVGLVVILSLSSLVLASEYIESRQPENGLDAEELATAIDENSITEAVQEEESYVESDNYEETEAFEEISSESEESKVYPISVSYRVIDSNNEWTNWLAAGEAAEADGGVLGLNIALSEIENLDVLYAVYDSANGWSEWISGTETIEFANPVSALRMTLSGDKADDYDIYYSVSYTAGEWTEWACNTEAASDLSRENCEITGIKVDVVPAGSGLDSDNKEEEPKTLPEETEVETEALTEAETDVLPEETEAETESTEVSAEVETEVIETEPEFSSEYEETEAEAESAEVSTEAETDVLPEETEAETESTEVSTEVETEVIETEPTSESDNTEVIEGTFHITTPEDDEDIIYVDKEGATYTELTQSNKGKISALNDYPNTYINIGKDKTDLISVAATQVGYYRAESTDTKYGVWYGYPKSAWCAMFVSWCSDQAGVSPKVIKPYCRCATEATWFKQQNRWNDVVGYTPKEGDLIFFHYNSATINHTGIVTGVENGYVYCIEGNHSDSVNITRHKLTANYLAGYGSPDYAEKTGSGTGSGTDKTPEKEIASVKYNVHVRSYGWLDYVLDGVQAGTTGESRRMEAVQVSLGESTTLSGSINYRVHVRSYGWMPWVSDGKEAGTTGEGRRMEAIEIKLTGELAEKYDVYYRAHVQSYGWLDWAVNGGMSGTSGLAKRMEAMEIQLVKKGGEAPGKTTKPYIKK